MPTLPNDALEAVVERVRSWPTARQEDAVRLLLAIEAEGADPYILSNEERADIDAALAEVARGEVAPEEHVAATFNRYR